MRVIGAGMYVERDETLGSTAWEHPLVDDAQLTSI